MSTCVNSKFTWCYILIRTVNFKTKQVGLAVNICKIAHIIPNHCILKLSICNFCKPN